MQVLKKTVLVVGVTLSVAPFLNVANAQSGNDSARLFLELQSMRTEIAELRDMIERQQYEMLKVKRDNAQLKQRLLGQQGAEFYGSGYPSQQGVGELPTSSTNVPQGTSQTTPQTIGQVTLPQTANSGYGAQTPANNQGGWQQSNPAVNRGGAPSANPTLGGGVLTVPGSQTDAARDYGASQGLPNQAYPQGVNTPSTAGNDPRTVYSARDTMANGNTANSVSIEERQIGAARNQSYSNDVPVVDRSITPRGASQAANSQGSNSGALGSQPSIGVQPGASTQGGQTPTYSQTPNSRVSGAPISANRVPTPPSGQTLNGGKSEGDFYEQGFSLLKQSNYDQAVDVFSEQLKAYPQGSLADDALYWTAEAKRISRKPEEAKQHLRQIIDNYPQSPRLPDAMLKTAYIEQQLGNEIEARILFQEIVNQHPSSDAAIAAKNRLEDFNASN